MRTRVKNPMISILVCNPRAPLARCVLETVEFLKAYELASLAYARVSN